MNRRSFLNKIGSFAVLGVLSQFLNTTYQHKEKKPYQKHDKNNKADKGNCIFYIDTDKSLYINSNAYRDRNGWWSIHK